jgi:lipoprotein NlpI
MKSSTAQITSVLPDELEAKRRIIQKTFIVLFLIASLPIIVCIICLLSWVVRLKWNLLACVATELAFVYACSYGVLRIEDKYLQRQCKKIGYVCPHCHEALFKILSKRDRFVEITGLCPSCKEPIALGISTELSATLKTEQKKQMGNIRKISLLGAALIVIGQGLHYYVDHFSSEGAATDFIRKKQYDQAITELSKELSINPRNVHALSIRGEAYVAKQMYDQALQDYNQALAINPKYSYALSDRCNVENQKNNYDAAITDCTDAIKISPALWQSFANRCTAYYGKEQYDLAISDCTNAIAANRDTFVPFFVRGAAYGAKYQYELAQKDMGEAIRLMPSNGTLYAVRGQFYVNNGQLDLAQQDFDKAQTLNPDSTSLRLGRGMLEALQESYAKAIDDLNHAVKEAPDEAYGVIWLHLSKWHLGQDDRVELEQLNAKTKKDKWPGSIVALYAGQSGVDAVQAQAKSADPSVEAEQICEAGYYLGEYYLEHNDRNNAKDFLKAAISSCPVFNFFEKQAAIEEFKAQKF